MELPQLRLAKSIRDLLLIAAPGSQVYLRGSLCDGTADAFSDIDLEWNLPASIFVEALSGVTERLNQKYTVAAVRSDPEFQLSNEKRLLFFRFAGWPIYWRLDLECRAQSPLTLEHRLRLREIEAPWSDAESALMNCVGALKQYQRKAEREARDLILRGGLRVGVHLDGDLSLQQMIERVCERVSERDSSRAGFAQEIMGVVLTISKTKTAKGEISGNFQMAQ